MVHIQIMVTQLRTWNKDFVTGLQHGLNQGFSLVNGPGYNFIIWSLLLEMLLLTHIPCISLFREQSLVET